jgi:peptidoglycan hydrolase CwlO-like protein
MEWTNFILSATSLILGAGWIFTYRAYKRRNEGEATQAEAEGWAKMQNVYQQTIDDLTASCNYIRNDRDLLRRENDQLRNENAQYREKIFSLEKQMDELRKEIARQGRRIEYLNAKNKN